MSRMIFKEFLLDRWLQEKATSNIRYNFGSSAGPTWKVHEVLALDGADAKEKMLHLPLVYSQSAGGECLRDSLAKMAGVPAEHVIVMTGAAECLSHIFLLAAEPGANVIVPSPCFPTHEVVPQAFGLETRSYRLLRTNDYRIDLDEVRGLIDNRTKLLLVNVPHNPTGVAISDQDMKTLSDLAVSRNIQFVCDEVHRPVFRRDVTRSAVYLPHATTIGDFSKAFSMPGLRLGWIIEPNAARRRQYCNAREYVTICNSPLTEFLAEIAARHHELIFERVRKIAKRNMKTLDKMFSRNPTLVRWIRPNAGMTGFPWLCNGSDSRKMCCEAALEGILLVPGDCLQVPDHFRIGFGTQEEYFEEGVEALEGFLCSRFG